MFKSTSTAWIGGNRRFTSFQFIPASSLIHNPPVVLRPPILRG